MKKGQKLKCLKSPVGYLTEGNHYFVSAGFGDICFALGCNPFEIKNESSFEVVDDQGDAIYQASIDGFHGKFAVVS